MALPYPKPHPPFPAPADTAVHQLAHASADDLQLHFHKGLQHDGSGRVVPAAFQSLRVALEHHEPHLFKAIQLAPGGTRKLVNPQAGLAADRETADGWWFKIPNPPERSGQKAATAAEMIELYWMALLRDLPFEQFSTDPDAAAAAAELSALKLYPDPETANNPQYGARAVAANTLFRGGDWTPAGRPNLEHRGPFVSQFLLLPVGFGTLAFDQRERRRAATDYPFSGPHLTDFDDWLDAQNGKDTTAAVIDVAAGTYIHNMGDLARYVHIDQLYEAYLNAALILLGADCPLVAGNPYVRANGYSKEQGFGTFGGPHILSMVCEVATRALKSVWYQKWVRHLRLRPEAYAGLVHRALAMDAPGKPAAETALGAGLAVLQQSESSGGAVDRIHQHNNTQGHDTYLLPMAFAEGSPIHPAYGAGHATVAGACVTVLKACFDESKKLVDISLMPQVPDPAQGYTALKDYAGADVDELTVRGELDKVAANIATGRNMAGVHWRSDYSQSALLGQRIAISMLYHQRRDYHERPWSFSFTSFGHNKIEIVNDPQAGREGVYCNGVAILDSNDDLDEQHEALALQRIV